MYDQNDFLHSTVNEVASMAAILVLKWFKKKKKKKKSSQVTKNPCFALNHLIYIFSIYIILYIYIIYIVIFFRRLQSVRLIRLEQRSLSVGKNFGLAKTLLGKEQDILKINKSAMYLPSPLSLESASGNLPETTQYTISIQTLLHTEELVRRAAIYSSITD